MLFHRLCRTMQPALDPREARATAFWLLDDVAALSQSDVLLGRADQLSEPLQTRLLNMAERVAKGEPVQYVLGHTEFCGLQIGVRRGVLIPRPETQQMTDIAISLLQQHATGTPLRIVDICTGSGCIALALKSQFPQATVEGWDKSDEALDIARQNAANLGLNINFRKVDALQPIEQPTTSVSLIISNPPYVLQSESAQMQSRVLDYEPSLALFVPDADPLLFYRAIATHARQMLAPCGHVVMECNRRFCNDVRSLFLQSGFKSAEVLDDVYDNPRFVIAS